MKQIFLFIISAACALSSGAHALPALGISTMAVTADTSEVTLRMTVDPAALRPGGDGEFIITPVLRSADGASADTLPAVVVAGRTRYFRDLRNPSAVPAGARLLRAGSRETHTYYAAVPFTEAMRASRLDLDVRRRGCCGSTDTLASTPIAAVDLQEQPFSAPEFVTDVPVVADGKTVELHGSALVNFRVNRTEIDPVYMNNPAELAKIIGTISQAREIPDATITNITIHGFASPEGRWDNNVRLAKGRTETLKEYVRGHFGLPDSVFATAYTPEDWGGLRDTVAVLQLPDKEGLLDIINSDLEPDERDNTLRRKFPESYAWLREHIYPSLRHSDYAVRYTIRQYTDLGEIRRVMLERPANLSLHEFYLLAASYPAGSEQRADVLRRASRVHPDAPESVYLRGMEAAARHDYAAARSLFEQARKAGIAEATEAIASLDAMHSARGVTYLTTDKK